MATKINIQLFCFLLIFVSILHICMGVKPIAFSIIIESIFKFDPFNFDHQIIISLRIPRLLAAIVSGASLGLAGAALQAITNNPLASPGITGMTSGAALFIVVSSLFISNEALTLYFPYLAALGAFLTFMAVIHISGFNRRIYTINKFTIVGITISAFISAVTAMILILSQDTFDALRLWLVGNLSGTKLPDVTLALLPVCFGGVLILSLIKQFNTLALGDLVAKNLGINTNRHFLVVSIACAFLISGSIICAGPIGFIGLMAPHLAKLINGTEYKWIFPLSMLIGSILLVVADILAVVLLSPTELATGLIVGLVGSPFFVYLVKRYI